MYNQCDTNFIKPNLQKTIRRECLSSEITDKFNLVFYAFLCFIPH